MFCGVVWGVTPSYKSPPASINTTVGSESVANVTTKSSSGTHDVTAKVRIDVRQYTTTAVVAGSDNVKSIVVTVTGAGAVDSSSGEAVRSTTATVATSV